MTCACPAQYTSGTGGGKPGEWGREGYKWQKKKDWEVGFLKGWKAGEICINKNNATIMLSNLLQSKKGYREEANQKERQKLRKQGIYLFIYQLFWTQACPEGMCTNGTQVSCEVPSLPNSTTHKGCMATPPGLQPLLCSNSDVGSFMSHKNKSVKAL